MPVNDENEEQLIRKFYEECGEDLLDPEKCVRLQETYSEKVLHLRDRLNLNNSDSEISRKLRSVKDTLREVNNLVHKSKVVQGEVHGHLQTTNQIESQVGRYFQELTTLENGVQYFKVLLKFDELSTALQKEIQNKDDEESVTIFANLCEICRNLLGCPVTNLLECFTESLFYWHNVLKEKLSKDFDEVLDAIKWPFVNANFSLQVPTQSSIQRLQLAVEYLFQIDLPEELLVKSIPDDFQRQSLPMQLFVKPLKKRFLYHFYGSRQTNRIDKPEWYFTQILSWIRDHSEFVDKWVQPVADRMGLCHMDAKSELMQGLVKIAVEKLYSDLPQMQYDDYTFSHCIDEALGFNKELRESYNYPATHPGVLIVLTQAQVFIKWLAMEKKYATEKMDSMLSELNSEAFQPVATDMEDFKVTNCVDTFVTLLQTITERYETLPQPGHRLQFLQLQLELLDDFRVRLLQLVNAEEGNVVESKIPMIINSIFYVEHILSDWGSMLHYLNLYYYKSQLDRAEPANCNSTSQGFEEDSPTSEIDSESVFADTLSLYKHMRTDLLCSLTESVIDEAKLQSKGYRWSLMPSHKDLRSFSLTPSACPIFEILALRLHQLKKSLASKLFSIAWKSIARRMDGFLFEELILDNRFSEGGARQLRYDITRNLFPLFADFSDKPETYFPQSNEACALLNITKGSALLLKETILALEGATGLEDRRAQALKEVGVTTFTPKMAVAVLNRRSDITINRLSID